MTFKQYVAKPELYNLIPQTRKTWLRLRRLAHRINAAHLRQRRARDGFRCGHKQQEFWYVGDGEGEYGDEVENEEAYERFGRGLDRHGAGAGMAGVGGM